MKKHSLLAFVAFCLLLVAALVGCGGSGGSKADGKGTATLRVTWPERTRLIPVASESITASFYNAGTLVATQTVARPTTGNVSTLTFTGLPATTLNLIVAAYPEEDGSGTAQARVSASVRVLTDQTIKVSAVMVSTIDEIVMTPATATVVVGGTRTLIATPVNTADDVVLVSDATTTWTSSDTAIATVDDDGVVTGKANGVATITFKESESGKQGTVVLTVGTGGGSGNGQIIDLANIYLDSLTTAQRTATVVEFNATNAAKWSDAIATPATGGTNALRNGVAYSSLTAAQKTAWENLVKAVLGTEGYRQFTDNQRAEDQLSAVASGYSGGYFYVGFVGTPSVSGSWIFQLGGHHFAQNHLFVGSVLQTTTPFYLASEPLAFTVDGTEYKPIEAQRLAMVNLLASLTPTQLSQSRITSSLTDVLIGPGKDARSNFPTGTAGRGLLAAPLTTAQKGILRTAIGMWTKNSAKNVEYLDLYDDEIDQTYIAFKGNASLNNAGDYVRIDGPHVWIEFICKAGEVQSAVHYHSVWRDRVTDYNAAFAF
ncbi:MAG: DUF3500 domain-containing protein [Fimbriimonas sp.]